MSFDFTEEPESPKSKKKRLKKDRRNKANAAKRRDLAIVLALIFFGVLAYVAAGALLSGPKEAFDQQQRRGEEIEKQRRR